MKTRQRQQHDDVWNLFVQACGSVCCACGRPDQKLQRGHIQRHADDGAGDLENLIPICKSCNAKHNKAMMTPHARPADWKERFLKLLIAHLGLGIAMVHRSERWYTGPDSVSVEDAGVISLEEIKFVPKKNYLPTSVEPHQPPTPEAIQAAVDSLISLGRDHSVVIGPPTRKTRDAMNRLAGVHGIENFNNIGREYLRRMDWFDERDGRITLLFRGHEWERFCENFSIYQADHKKRLAEEARQAEVNRRTEKWYAKEAAQQREREADPEYRRQQEVQRLADEKLAQDRRDARKKEHLINVCRLAFEELWRTAPDWNDGGLRERAFYSIRELLREMPNASLEELPGLREKFIQLMEVLKKPSAEEPSQGGDSEDSGGLEL